MTPKSKLKYILITAISVVVISTAAFSTSYAKWIGGENDLASSVSSGAWEVTYDMNTLTDDEITQILREAGCVIDGKVCGAVTSTGQTVKFGEPVELAPGEELVVFYGGARCTSGIATDRYTIRGDVDKYFDIEKADGDGRNGSVLKSKDGGSFVLSQESFGLIRWIEVNPV